MVLHEARKEKKAKWEFNYICVFAFTNYFYILLIVIYMLCNGTIHCLYSLTLICILFICALKVQLFVGYVLFYSNLYRLVLFFSLSN